MYKDILFLNLINFNINLTQWSLLFFHHYSVLSSSYSLVEIKAFPFKMSWFQGTVWSMRCTVTKVLSNMVGTEDCPCQSLFSVLVLQKSKWTTCITFMGTGGWFFLFLFFGCKSFWPFTVLGEQSHHINWCLYLSGKFSFQKDCTNGMLSAMHES